jgi:hypothetical protein
MNAPQANTITISSFTAKRFSVRMFAALHRQLKICSKQAHTYMEFTLQHLPGSPCRLGASGVKLDH